MDPEQGQQQHQHRYPYKRRERIFYTMAGVLLTVDGALLITRSRFVQTFVPPKPTNPTASPSITVVNPNQLYRYIHHHLPTIIAIVTATLSTLFPVLFLTGHRVHERQLENVLTRIMVKILSFSLSTLAFYLATRVGTKIFMYHNLPVPHNLKVLSHDASKILDLQFEAEEEIKNLLFVDPWTIATVAIFSLSSLCLARLMPNPDRYYHMHEVSLDLTCHLAGDYFGGDIFNSGLVFVSCVIVIIAKELTEPRRHGPPATPDETCDDHPPEEPPPAHREMQSRPRKKVEIYPGERSRIQAAESSTSVRGRSHDRSTGLRGGSHDRSSVQGGIWANTSHVQDEDEVTSPPKLFSIMKSLMR